MKLTTEQIQFIADLKKWHETEDSNAINIQAKAGSGKEQPNSEPVLTPEGFVPIGQLKINDLVIGSNGLPTKVLGVYPQGLKDVYEIIFSDNSVVRCGLDHLWTVKSATKKATETINTETLIARLNKQPLVKFTVPRFNGLETGLINEPYAWQLGYAYGNGCFTSHGFLISCHTKDLALITKQFDSISSIPGRYRATSENGRQGYYSWKSLPDLFKLLKNSNKEDLSLIGWSKESVTKFFAGYFDADGCTSGTNKSKFSCSNKKLFSALVDIARSAGHRVCVSPEQDTRQKNPSFRATIVFCNVDNQLIKKPELPKCEYHFTPSIKEIKHAGYKEESICIKVEASDSLYVTAGYKLTHNTTCLCIYAETLKPNTVTFLGPTHASLTQLRQRVGTGFNFMTVAAALNSFPVVSNTSVETKFASFGGKTFNGLVIVDESSMLSLSEVQQLINNCEKVIFSGDSNQLPPVKKKSGQPLLITLPQLTLTTMMRTESSLLIAAGLNALNYTQYIPDSTEDQSVVKHETYDAFLEAFLNAVKEEKPGDCVWITRTNKEVEFINALAHKTLTGRTSLEPGDTIRLYATSKLGPNNTLAIVRTVEPCPGNGTLLITTEPEDGTNYKVEVALPDSYALIEKRIESIVELFKADQGNNAYEVELKALRSIVEIDFCYSITTNKSQGASIPVVFANSQKLHGKRAFYVAYSRAAKQLNVVVKPGMKQQPDLNSIWYNEALNYEVKAPFQNVAEVRAEIETAFPGQAPSISHLSCVLNLSHSAKSAKGWKLVTAL